MAQAGQQAAGAVHGDGRYYSLDVLRGIGAIAVVFWHWQHFCTGPAGLDPGYFATAKPLDGLFHAFYAYGYLAVDLFFALSGFIFYRLYATPIGSGAVGGWRFFALRFSRLYPLHLATLLLVVALQIAHQADYGAEFVSHSDDLPHLLLNLFLLNGIIHKTEYSFNVPSWSISVEALLYVIFFWSQRARLAKLAPLAAIALAGLLVRHVNLDVGRGIWGFFEGCFIAELAGRVQAGGRARPVMLACGAVAVASLLLLVAGLELGWKGAIRIDLHPLVHHVFDGARLPDGKIAETVFTYLVTPALILGVVLAEERLSRITRHLSTVGDVSYSVYLLHFPLQIVAVLALGHDRAIYAGVPFFLAFWAVLLPLAYLSYRMLELPAQRALRGALDPRKRRPRPAVAEG